MPVTIRFPRSPVGLNEDKTYTKGKHVLAATFRDWNETVPNASYYFRGNGNHPLDMPVMQSFCKDLPDNDNERYIPYGNGFVNGIFRDLQQDLHLILRPDDLWLANLI